MESKNEIGKPFNPFIEYGLVNCIVLVSAFDTDSDLKILLLRLLVYGGNNGEAFPTRRLLLESLNWERSRLDRTIRELKDNGLIKTSPINGRLSNQYTFLFNDSWKKAEVIIGRCSHIREDLEGENCSGCSHIREDLEGENKARCSRSCEHLTDEKVGRCSHIREGGVLVVEKQKDKMKDKEEDSKESSMRMEEPSSGTLIKRRTAPVTKLVIKTRNKTSAPSKPTFDRSKYKIEPETKSNKEPLNIPKRTLEAINYWNEKPCTPSLLINLDNPSKRLLSTIKAFSLFFSGKLFLGTSHIKAMPKSDLDDLVSRNSLEDFKDFVDYWEKVITSGRFKVNSDYLASINLLEFLKGNPHMRNNNGGLYCPLVEFCYYSPATFTEDKNPEVTTKLKELWETHIIEPTEEQHEIFVKVANKVSALFQSKVKETGYDPSDMSSFPGPAYLVVEVLTNNKDFISRKKSGPEVLLGNWAKEQFLELWS